jgi:phytoene dehydrogenase-like protein
MTPLPSPRSAPPRPALAPQPATRNRIRTRNPMNVTFNGTQPAERRIHRVGAGSRKAELLQVTLYLGHRAGCRLAGVLAELAPGAALAQQVPALVERLLGGSQPRALLGAGQLARGKLGAQIVLSLDQLINVAEDLLVVHVTTVGGQSDPRSAGPDTVAPGSPAPAARDMTRKDSFMRPSRYDVVIVGGGHNGLVAAAYLAGAGRSVLILERLDHVGGVAVSARAFAGVDARLSRYSYLVSLLPRSIVTDLGLRIELRSRQIASYTPVGSSGLLVDSASAGRTAASFRALTGGDADWAAWQRLYAATARMAGRMFPTMTEPLRSRAQMRTLAGDDALWEALIDSPLAGMLERDFADDTVRGVVLTDALIGTFARAGEASLLQNRCFLYHVIGNGTGAWDVPVGGMGAVSDALREAALAAGAQIRTGAEVTGIDPAGEVLVREGEREYSVGAGHILAGVAPVILARLLGEDQPPAPEGAQLKVNLVLSRLPRLRDPAADPRTAFAGTFHVHEGYAALEESYQQAAAGQIPPAAPCEAYCHSLTDSSILGAELAASGAQTLTVFGLHMPARLFRADPGAAREAALRATLQAINSVLAEPIEDCLLLDGDGQSCLEVKSPVDLELEAGLPGGHIFHGDLAWPFAEDSADVGRWGVETRHERVLVCGAGARRGGGVSGIGGHNAAMSILRGRP